ncbi:MAG: YhbY family RNA-binding protein [Halobacteriota archaeon]|uniref:YhbY family RNA-binding protein n=1 Tax=Natronomonas sp. TaxID=2184060 RepID=UPI003976221F
MSPREFKRRIHDLDPTVWVGKSGLDPVADELSDQLADTDLVKVKFLRSSRGGATTEALAGDLADRVGAELVDTRGHTAVYTR